MRELREFERMADNLEGMMHGMISDVNQMIRLAEYIGIGLAVLVGIFIFITLIFACFMRGAFAKLLSFCLAITLALLHLEQTAVETLYRLAGSGHGVIRAFTQFSETVNGFYLNQVMIDKFTIYFSIFMVIFFVFFFGCEFVRYQKNKRNNFYENTSNTYTYGEEDFYEESYRILGVNITAGEEEIKNAYRKLVKKYHPDVGGDAKKFKRVQEAYQKIKEELLFT